MASILAIKVPTETIQLSGEKQDSMSFAGFIRWTLATHSNFNSDASGIRASARLERHIEKAEMPEEILLDEEDWQRLRVAVENPQGGYPIRPGSRLLPFVDAITSATPKE
jgi:hypothetical protein